MIGKAGEAESQAPLLRGLSLISEVHFKDRARCIGRLGIAGNEGRPAPHADLDRRVRLVFDVSDGIVSPVFALLHPAASQVDSQSRPVISRIILSLARAQDPGAAAAGKSQIGGIQRTAN